MNKKFLVLSLIIGTSFLFTNCEKDEPEIPNEEELITTLNYELSPSGGGDVVTLSFKDLDGDGGDAAVTIGGTLVANQTYTGSLDLLNEAETIPESITAEILEEADDHQFFFQSDIAGLNIVYSDQDTEGNPLGLNTSLSTGDAGSGTITIILRHQPEKTEAGVSDGDITNAGGETDIQVTFPIDVQ